MVATEEPWRAALEKTSTRARYGLGFVKKKLFVLVSPSIGNPWNLPGIERLFLFAVLDDHGRLRTTIFVNQSLCKRPEGSELISGLQNSSQMRFGDQ